MLISGGGEVRLIDLGVAQALQRAGLRAPVRRPYSAPERMEGRAWGGPADIFALGAIVYEMVTGKRVAGPGVPAVSAEGISGLDAGALAEVLGRALHEEPGSRFASASDLDDELRPILARGRRAVLAPRRLRSRPEGVVPLPLESEPPVLEAFDPEVTLTPTMPAAIVDLPLSHGESDEPTSAEPRHDVFAAVTPEAPGNVEPEPPLVPAAAPSRPEPSIPLVEPPPVIERELAREPAERPIERTSFASWSTPPPEPDRRSLVIPLSFAMLLGLAGGFGLGYWTGWRSALRDTAATEASGFSAAEGRASSASEASHPRASEASAPSSSVRSAAPASEASPPRANEVSAPAAGAKAPAPSTSAASPPRREAAPPREATGRAPAARSAASGRLLVKSTPSGAQVRVDGRVRGKTPLILRELPLKVVRVTVEHGGYRADEQRVALTAAKPTVTVDAKLTPLAPPAPVATTGSLVIESRPTGARAFLDGQELGTTPVSVPDVAPGQHRVRLEMTGFSPWVTMTEIKAGVRSRVAASLEQGQGQ